MMTRTSHQSLCIAALIVLVCSAPASIRAATLTVNGLDDVAADDGQCTLREAIISANTTNPSGSMPGECVGGQLDPVVDRVEFGAGLSGTIGLVSGLPQINDPVDIVGPGPADLIIDGSAITTRALRVIDDVLIEGLSIINTPSSSSGGAINADQPLTLRNMFIENNQATDGGGVYTTADLTVEACVFRGNVATDFDGGAIRLANSAQTLTVRDSLFENNTTGVLGRNGGAIQVGGSDHVTEITGSTFVGNAALGSNREGGAIRIGGASLTIVNSTFSGNAATGSGGAISLRAQDHHFSNITVVDNTADSEGDGFGDGGGLWNGADAPATLENTLIAANTDNGNEAPDCQGAYTSGGFNLIGVASACTGFTDGVDGDQVGAGADPIDPLLQALADNGGPTPTLALMPGSPAIDAGNPTGCSDSTGAPLLFDQRGNPRPADGDGDGSAICDVGAFELVADLIFADRFQATP